MSSINPNNSSTKDTSIPSLGQAGVHPPRVSISVSPDQVVRIRNLSQAPGYLLADANGCKDLVEYGDKLGLEFSHTDKDEKIFLETQKSADDKFTHYLQNTSEESLLHGDRFLIELLQADITELETKPNLKSILLAQEANVLPLLVLSKKDSTGQLSHEDESKYKSLLNRLYKDQIEHYVSKAPQDRDANDYVERIRRILRTNARLIDESSLPRNLSDAWENQANTTAKLTRRQMLTISGLGATAVGAGVLAVLYGNSRDRVSELNRVVVERESELEQRRNLSISKGDTIPTSTQEQIVKMLTSTEKQFFLDLSNALIEQAKKSFPNESGREITFLIGNLEPNKIRMTNKNEGRIHITIPTQTFQKLYKDVTNTVDTSKKEKLLLLLPEHL